MSEITKEEVSLCKQIAEKHRKNIEYGAWLLNPGGFAKVWPYRNDCNRIDVIPFWTISDCLEFLEEKECTYILYFYSEASFDSEKVWHEKRKGWYELSLFDFRKHEKQLFIGETRLEACLKAVLAVLENKS